MKKLLFLLLFPVAYGQNLGLDSAGNLFPQTDATKWIGSESNRFYMIGTKQMTIKGDINPLRIKTEAPGQQGGIELWGEQEMPVWTLGPRGGDSNRFYISGLLGMGNGNDVAMISTNMIPAITTRGYVYHNGSLSITGVFNIPIAGTKQILSAGSTINVTNNSAVRIESTGGAVKLTAPNISTGREGDLIWITGDSITNTVELVDESIQGGSRIRFATGTNRIVALYKWFGFRYVDSHNVWELISESAPTTAAAGGSGDVTAASNFAADSKVILSDGAGTKGVKSSVINVDALGNITGVNTIVATNSITSSFGPTVTNNFANDERVLRSDGTLRGIQGSNVGLADNGAFVFPTGIRQVFAPDSLNAGICVGAYNGIPSTMFNGNIWFNTGENSLYSINSSSTQPFALSSRDNIVFTLNQFRPQGGPAPILTQTEDTDCWTFVDNQDSYIQTQFMGPDSMGTVVNSLSVDFLYSMTNAASGNISWGVSFMVNTGAEDANSSGYSPLVLSTNNPISVAAGIPIIGVVGASGAAGHDNIGKGKLVKFRFMRDGDGAVDTASNLAELLAIRLSWVRKN